MDKFSLLNASMRISEIKKDQKWRVFMALSPQKSDNIEAEIWYGDTQWAILTEYNDVILFRTRREEEPGVFKIKELLGILKVLSREDTYACYGLPDPTRIST
jgi:hypothetical protein